MSGQEPAQSAPETRPHGPYVRLLLGPEPTEDSNQDIVLSEVFYNHDHSAPEASPHDSLLTSQLTVIINDPQVLLSLGNKLSNIIPGSSTTPIQSHPSLSTKPNTFSLHPSQIQTLQIGLLAPITPTDPLTLSELNGSIDGPFMSALVKSWRLAFRSLPSKHGIEVVTFDMRCQREIEVRHVIRLVQEVGTGMYLKVKRGMGREVRFEVVGVGDERKKGWLEGCLPGGKRSEASVEG